MDIIVTIVLVLLSFLFKRSKIVALLFFLFMWSLWGWNTWNGDYDAYKAIYQDSITRFNTQGNEIGYVLLNGAFLAMGFEFQGFMIIFSLIVLSIVLFFTLRYSKYPALFSALYFIIFIMEYVFMRNYLVHSIMLLAFFLSFKKVNYHKLFFSLITILSVTIHSTAILFFLFIPALKETIVSFKKIALVVTLLLISSIIFFNKILLPLLGPFFAAKFAYYQTGGGISNVFLAHIAIVTLVYYFFTQLLKSSATLSPQMIRMYTIVINVNLLSLFYLCLYFHVPYFSRILRFLFTFDLIFLLSGLHFVKWNLLRIKMFVIGLLIYFAVVVMFLKSTLSLTVYPLYKLNAIWGEESYVPDFDFNEKE